MAFAGNRGVEVELPAATAADGGGSDRPACSPRPSPRSPGCCSRCPRSSAAAVTAQLRRRRRVRASRSGARPPRGTCASAWRARRRPWSTRRWRRCATCGRRRASSWRSCRRTRRASPRSRPRSPRATRPAWSSHLRARADARRRCSQRSPAACQARGWPCCARRAPTATARWRPPSTPRGSQPWDVTHGATSSRAASRRSIGFRGAVVCVGGFSYADVLGSAKGWAACAPSTIAGLCERSLPSLPRAASDTFSLGVCNGCQLMALLGWVPGGGARRRGAQLTVAAQQPRFVHNASGRFESRFSSVKVLALARRAAQGHGGHQPRACGSRTAKAAPTSRTTPRSSSACSRPRASRRSATSTTRPTSPPRPTPHNPNGSPHGIAALRIGRRPPPRDDAAPRARASCPGSARGCRQVPGTSLQAAPWLTPLPERLRVRQPGSLKPRWRGSAYTPLAHPRLPRSLLET